MQCMGQSVKKRTASQLLLHQTRECLAGEKQEQRVIDFKEAGQRRKGLHYLANQKQ